MSLAAAVKILQTALVLLTLISAHPELPQSFRDSALSVAKNAVMQATQALTTEVSTSPNNSNSCAAAPSPSTSCTAGWKAVINSQHCTVAWTCTTDVSAPPPTPTPDPTTTPTPSAPPPSTPAASCTFNGLSIVSGTATTAYQAASVAYGQSCVSQTRTCTNGSLSGAYTYNACTVAVAPQQSGPLTFDKTTYTGGDTITVTWNYPGATTAKDWITIVPAGNTWTADDWLSGSHWFYTDGLAQGSKTLTALNSSGTYQLVYYANDGFQEVVRSTSYFTIKGIPRSAPVVFVLEENQSLSATGLPGASAMPYLSGLLSTHGALLGNYYANTHPSVANFNWLLSGGNNDITDNNCTTIITNNNLFRQLIGWGIKFRVYIDHLSPLTATDFVTCSAAMQANSEINWGFGTEYSDIRDQGAGAWNVEFVDFSQFASDVANHNLPPISFVLPNLNEDAHNNTNLTTADTWLRNNMSAYVNSSDLQAGGAGTLIVGWDEGYWGFTDASAADWTCSSAGGNTCGGHTPLVIYGPKIKPGFVSQVYYQHPSVLRTIMEMLGFWRSFPQASATAADIRDVFVAQ